METECRLTGGVFFHLFLDAVSRKLKPSDKLKEQKEPNTNSNILFKLAQIMHPEKGEKKVWFGKAFETNVSEYKSCKTDLYPFYDKYIAEEFTRRIKNNYNASLQLMEDLVQECIDPSVPNKYISLVKNFLALLEKDSSIDANQVLHVCENEKGITKNELLSLDEICLQPFLLGIFHFAVTRDMNNIEGKTTIDVIAPPQNHAIRVTKNNLFNLYGENKKWPKVYLKKYIPEDKKKLPEESINSTENTIKKALSKNNNPKELYILYVKFKDGENSYYTKEKIDTSVPLDSVENIKVGGFYKTEATVTLRSKRSYSFEDMIYISFTHNGMNFTGCTSADKWISKSDKNRCLAKKTMNCVVWMEIDEINGQNCEVVYMQLGVYR